VETLRVIKTRLLSDILRQPSELRACAARLADSAELRNAARLLAGASETIVTGIGASGNAAIAAAGVLARLGRPARVIDASEFPFETVFRPGSIVLALSRSGRSIEFAALPEQCRRLGLRLIAVTNSPESPLARGADAVVPLGVGFDHAVSVVTYTAVALGAALAIAGAPPRGLGEFLDALESAIPAWRRRIEDWEPADGPAYFLGRGARLAAAREARLLWEEAVKAPATALGTGEFRHGPQEIVRRGLLVGLWLDADRRRREDLDLARDLETLGATVLRVGPDLPDEGLSFRLPPIDSAWQFLADALPAQLAAERAARVRGVDCDTFRLCSHVVLSEGGLLAPEMKGDRP
jgi:glucosamine--fructose-6-phosphate aminotransferase (isomerizing)